MGKIYQILKNMEYQESICNDTGSTYISFADFINFLGDYTQDSQDTITSYLLNVDDFLKLDIYYNTKPYLNTFNSFSRYSYRGMAINSDGEEVAEEFEEDLAFATEYYLEDADSIKNSYEMYWKIDDILAIKEIKDLGLTRKIFDNLNADIDYDDYQKILQENEFLSKRISLLRNNSFDVEIIELMKEIDLIKKELQSKNDEISILKDQSKGSAIPNQELHPRTANNASKIILAMAELLKWDLSKPHAKETNGTLQEVLERQGNKLSKDTIGYWLKQAFEAGK